MVGANASDPVIQPVRPDEPHPRLTEREAQILDGLVKGHANKVIARTCDIAEETVKVHIRSILQKIRVAARRRLFGQWRTAMPAKSTWMCGGAGK
jgi:DNA-binding NarL/FixJ family response regulator